MLRLKTQENDAVPDMIQLLWTCLVMVLGKLCHASSSILLNHPFNRARISQTTVSDVSELEGRASLLVNAYMPPQSVAEADATDRSGTHESQAVDPNNEEDPDKECTMSSSTIDASEKVLDIDLPLHAHIVPGTGRRVDCVLPVICSADEDTIVDLVSSVVCQRFVLGSTLPVAGITFDATTARARFVIGWFEVVEENSDPIIHVASASPQASDRMVGVFNMLDPVEALLFAQVLVSFSHQFENLLEIAQNACPSTFCWRLDQLPFETIGYEGVQGWLQTLDLDFQPDSMAKTASLTSSESETNSTKSTPSDAGSNMTSPSQPSKARKGSPAAASSKIPKSGEGSNKWHVDRYTVRLSRIKFAAEEGADTIEAQANQMMDRYDEMIRFWAPSHWVGTNKLENSCNLPDSYLGRMYDGPVKDLLESLEANKSVTASTALGNEENTNYNESEKDRIDTQDSSAFLSVRRHLSTFLMLVLHMQVSQKHASIKDGSVGESQARNIFSLMTMMACCDPNEVLSRSYLQERTTSMPIDRSREDADADPNMEQHRHLYYMNMALVVQQMLLASRSAHEARVAAIINMVIRNATPSSSKIVDADRDAAERREDIIKELLNAMSSVRPPEDNEVQTMENSEAKADGIMFVEAPEEIDSGGKEVFLTSTTMHSKPVGCQFSCDAAKKFKNLCHSAEKAICIRVTANLSESQYKNSGLGDYETIAIPLILREDKQDFEHDQQGLHRCQLYVTSTVECLASLGIRDFPVFGVVTEGSIASLIVAWQSTKIEYTGILLDMEDEQRSIDNGIYPNFIVDRDLAAFDLANPFDAYRFMMTMHRIYLRTGAELLDKLKLKGI